MSNARTFHIIWKFSNNFTVSKYKKFLKFIEISLTKPPSNFVENHPKLQKKKNIKNVFDNLTKSEMPNGLCMFPSLYRNVHNNSNKQKQQQ